MMLVGMMVVGASAASFPDSDKIEHTEAVDSMVALGIIKGKDNGNFDPEGNVTRAEMAKMICVAMNGGKDPQLTGKAAYSDTVNHWAAGYIQWCTNLRYVSGYNGMFRPDDTVTGTEAAKMLLVAIGYNAQQEKFENDAAWDTNINVAANLKGLFEDLAISPDATLTRDSAAQMMWNAVNAEMVEYEFQGFIVDGTSITVPKDNGRTILDEKFKMNTTFGYMTGVSYDSKKDEYTYTFSDGKSGSTWAELDDITDKAQTKSLTTEKDFSDLFGMKVKVLSKTTNDKTTVYGMYDVDTTVLFEGVGDDIDGNKYDGTKYESNTGATSYAYNVSDKATAITSIPGETAFKLIDNNDDGKADIAVTYPVTVGKVTYVGKDSITAGNVSYKFKDADIYEDVKKNDYVVITAAENTKNDTPVIVKAEVLTGTIGATKTGEVKVDGTWYKDASTKAGDSYALNKEFELVIVNGFVYNAKQTSEKASAEKVVYVTAIDEPVASGTSAGTQKVTLLFVDGSKKTVTVDKTNVETTNTMAAPSNGNKVAADTLFTYATDSDGNYELTKMVDGDYDTTNTDATTVKDGKTNGTNVVRFNADSVVFVRTTDGKVKVVKGDVVAKWDETNLVTAAGKKTSLYANASSGFQYVVVGILDVNAASVPGVKGDTAYGWVTSDPSLVKDGDDYFVQVDIWNGSETFTAMVKNYTASGTAITSSTTLSDVTAKGTPVSYKALADNKVEKLTSLASSADAVKAYAGGKDIEFVTAGAATITDDTVIIYVNTADNEGVEGGSIETAQETAFGGYVNNVYVAVASDEVTYLIVDTGNNLDANAGFTAKKGTYVKDIDGTSITVASGTTASALKTEVEGWGTGAAAKVYDAGGTEKSDGTSVAANWTVTVVGKDGSTETYTVVEVQV